MQKAAPGTKGANAFLLREIAAEAAAAFNSGSPSRAALHRPLSETSRWTMPIASRRSSNDIRLAQGLQAGRPQDRLHQPPHLGRIRRARADLGLCLRPHSARPRGTVAACALQRTEDRAGNHAGPLESALARHGRYRTAHVHRLGRARLRDRAVDLSRLEIRAARCSHR